METETETAWETATGSRNILLPLRDLVGMAFRRRRAIILAFAGLMAGFILAILILSPTYEAEMKILVQRERVGPCGIHRTECQPVRSQSDIGRDYVGSRIIPKPRFSAKDSSGLRAVSTQKPLVHWGHRAAVLGALRLAPDTNTRIYKAVLKMETKDLQVMLSTPPTSLKLPINPNRRNSRRRCLRNWGAVPRQAHGRSPATRDGGLLSATSTAIQDRTGGLGSAVGAFHATNGSGFG